MGSLEEITVPQNGIRPEGVLSLAEAFKENKNLKVSCFYKKNFLCFNWKCQLSSVIIELWNLTDMDIDTTRQKKLSAVFFIRYPFLYRFH